MKPTGQQIQDLVGQVTELTWSYAIWWELVDNKNRSKFEPAFKQYPNFFAATAFLMQQSICVIIRRLFDSRNDVLSIPKLVNELNATHPQVAIELKEKIDKHSGLVEKCTLLRHKVYAHRDGKLSPESTFKQVEIKPKEFRQVVHLIHDLVATLSEVERKNSKAKMLDTFQHCERDAATETGLIIEDIRRSRPETSDE